MLPSRLLYINLPAYSAASSVKFLLLLIIFMFLFADISEKKIAICKKKVTAGDFIPNVKSVNAVCESVRTS